MKSISFLYGQVSLLTGFLLALTLVNEGIEIPISTVMLYGTAGFLLCGWFILTIFVIFYRFRDVKKNQNPSKQSYDKYQQVSTPEFNPLDEVDEE